MALKFFTVLAILFLAIFASFSTLKPDHSASCAQSTCPQPQISWRYLQ